MNLRKISLVICLFLRPGPLWDSDVIQNVARCEISLSTITIIVFSDHDIRIIRPFIYVRERALDAFACARSLPDFRVPSDVTNSPPDSPAHSDDSGDNNDNG